MTDHKTSIALSPDQLAQCLSTLENLVNHSELLATIPEPQRILLMKIAGQLSRPDKSELKKRRKEKRQAERLQIVSYERQTRASTGIRTAREAPIFTAPKQLAPKPEKEFQGELKSPRNCYICKKEFTRLHFFYDALCPDCAVFNYAKRFQSAPLQGRVALITGSRLKIGYQATLLMLRAGARVIATTRFPIDAASRFAREADYEGWADRLQIYGLDLRHTPSVDIFAGYVKHHYDRLDILINNAAQTVRRPPAFYAHLMNNEHQGIQCLPESARGLVREYEACKSHLNCLAPAIPSSEPGLPISWNGPTPGIGLRASAELSQIPYAYDSSLPIEKVFPSGQVDADLQQIDLRETNSWRLTLGEIHPSEMLELQLVNAVAPFVLCNHLIPLMKQDFTGQKHIVNVSAMEGKFLRFKKGDRHPHTNMAKAALNMLTHTAADGLKEFGIYMNAVDTGWVTDEDPAQLAARKQQLHDFQPPLDIVDGAARVCDPFFHGILSGSHWCGKFLKDYFPIDW